MQDESKGDCWDNAVGESFYATVKGKMVERADFVTPAQAINALFDYIEVSMSASDGTRRSATSRSWDSNSASTGVSW